jgi:hypothetical protein
MTASNRSRGVYGQVSGWKRGHVACVMAHDNQEF